MEAQQTDREILRNCRKIVLDTMTAVRCQLRSDALPALRRLIENDRQAVEDATKAVDQAAEDLMIAGFEKPRFRELLGGDFVVFSEERGVGVVGEDGAFRRIPRGQAAPRTRFVIIVDPIDGSEFAVSLQGAWCLLAVYDRGPKYQDPDGSGSGGETVAAVAGDILLDRLYWATREGPAEILDFATHSWHELHGSDEPMTSVAGCRLNVLTTKVQRFQAFAQQCALMDALGTEGRINLAWGSNLVIQVAAGFADVALECARGFALYDILPGWFIAERAGLTILDLDHHAISTRDLPIHRVLEAYLTPDRTERDEKINALRRKFVVAQSRALAHAVLDKLNRA